MSTSQSLFVQPVTRVEMVEKIRRIRSRKESGDSFSSLLKQAAKTMDTATNAERSGMENSFLDTLGRA